MNNKQGVSTGWTEGQNQAMKSTQGQPGAGVRLTTDSQQLETSKSHKQG